MCGEWGDFYCFMCVIELHYLNQAINSTLMRMLLSHSPTRFEIIKIYDLHLRHLICFQYLLHKCSIRVNVHGVRANHVSLVYHG